MHKFIHREYNGICLEKEDLEEILAMSNSTNSETTRLQITGAETQNHTVSVEVLVRLLNGMQQLTWILAAVEEQQPFRHRFKPSAEFRSRYRLRCGTPEPGSYNLPLELINEEKQGQLFSPASILPKMHSFLDAVGKEDVQNVKQILPESQFRDRALRVVQNFAPKRGELWSANFQIKDSTEVSLNDHLTHNIDRWLLSGLEDRITMTVTGELVRINFDEHKLFIRHPATNRQLECSYRPETEVELLESRRDLIQVTGEFILDNEGNPLRFTDVTHVEAVDLSPLVFETLEFEGRILSASSPLKFIPRLDDETQQLYIVENRDLDLHVCGYTRDQLIDELTEQIFLTWDAYAKETPDRLTEKARELQKNLQDRFKEGR